MEWLCCYDHARRHLMLARSYKLEHSEPVICWFIIGLTSVQYGQYVLLYTTTLLSATVCLTLSACGADSNVWSAGAEL
jgi:hypothetical protein